MKNPKWQRDEIILALNLYFDKKRGPIDARNHKIIELSELLNKLPIHQIRPDKTTFRNVNGVSLKLSNFLAIDKSYSGSGMTSFSKLDRKIFEEFENNKDLLKQLASDIKTILENDTIYEEILKIEDDDTSVLDSVKEGQIMYKIHKLRERNRSIVVAKKNSALKKYGTLTCEACGFNFEKKYGKLGEGFIECHHLLPLSRLALNDVTRLEDLALVCSNCHRIFHRDLSISSIKDFKNRFRFI